MRNFSLFIGKIITRITLIIRFIAFFLLSIISFAIVIVASLFGRSKSHYVIRHIIRPVFNLFFPLQIEGEEYIEDSGGIILAGNHTGVLDSAIIEIASKRPVTFLMASWVQNLFVIGWLAKRLKTIAISKKHLARSLSQVIERLKAGEILCIFPEGTPTPTGNICKFEKGVAYIHKKSKAPIIPFAIQGGYEAWPWRVQLPTFREITIQFGPPYCNFEEKEKVIVEQLKKRVQYMKNSLEKREKTEKPYYDNFLALMQLKFDIYAPFKALSFQEKGKWEDLSYAELARLSQCMANYLIEQGVQSGDRVAILSESRPEWAIAFFASIISGAIVVPLDIKLTFDELKPLVLNCEPHTICVSPNLIEKANRLKNEIQSIEQVFVIDKNKCSEEFNSLYGLKEYSEEKRRERNLDETALIVYTSGTTGNPKGVMITFRNIISQVKNFDEVFNFTSRESLISILPLNHLLEITVGFITMLYRGAQITYTTTLYPQEFMKIMQEKKVTRLVTVPLFLKVLKMGIEREVNRSNKLSQSLFQLFFNVSKFIPFNFLRKQLFFKIHSRLGGEIKGFISGGAPLDIDIAEFFTRIGIPIYQGYGLTETSPVISANTPKYNRLGSVGKPLPNVMVKISQEEEILVKGPNVMKGYYNRPDLTNEAIDKNGWFHTGDKGRIDDDGYLYVTGRLKNIIVLSGGDKVQPEEVEAVLSKSPIIKELCVIGVPVTTGPKKGTEEVLSVVIPTEEMQNKFQDDTQKLENVISQEINKFSQSLTVYKRPDRIVVRMEDFPKTTTGKIKRKQVLDWYYSQD